MATVPLKQMPLDVRVVYVTSGIYWGALAMTVLVGPELLIFLILGMSVCVVLPVIGWAGLWVLSHIVEGEALRPRRVPLLLVILSLSTVFLNPMAFCVDLHVMTRIYCAGPDQVNEWAQKLMDGDSGDRKARRHVEVPLEFRRYFQGYVSIHGKPDMLPSVLRIEMGGGFYHYRILIVSKAKASEANWWQGLLNWPPEVDVYHDES